MKLPLSDSLIIRDFPTFLKFGPDGLVGGGTGFHSQFYAIFYTSVILPFLFRFHEIFTKMWN